MRAKSSKSSLSSAQRKALKKESGALPAEYRQRFEVAFNAWKDAWYRGGLLICSNPHLRAVGKEYDDLIALGPAIIPLVIEKLADPENFLGLQLYGAIQPDPKLLVYFEPDDPRILEGETGRARRTVQAYFTNR